MTEKKTEHYKHKEILIFGDIEIENDKFYCYKSSIFAEDVDIDIELVSNKIYFGEKNYKCFIDYLYNVYEIKP